MRKCFEDFQPKMIELYSGILIRIASKERNEKQVKLKFIRVGGFADMK